MWIRNEWYGSENQLELIPTVPQRDTMQNVQREAMSLREAKQSSRSESVSKQSMRTDLRKNLGRSEK